MPSWELTEDQREFRKVLRRFVEEKVAPGAAGYDEREEYPWESFRACVELGLPYQDVLDHFSPLMRRGDVDQILRQVGLPSVTEGWFKPRRRKAAVKAAA